MKNDTTKLLQILGALLGISVFSVSTVRATTVAEIDFVNRPPIISSPGATTLDRTDSQLCCGSGHAFADIPLGKLRAELTAQSPFALPGGADAYSLRVAITDLFTLSGGPLGSQYMLPATLSVTGTGLAPLLDEDTPAPGGQSFGFVKAIAGNGGFAAFVFTTSTPAGAGEIQVAPDIAFPISIAATDFLSVTYGTPFQLTYALIIEGANETTLDVFNTANLSFALPPGASISSAGGYSQTAVPEPSTCGLLGLAVLGLLAYHHVRTMRKQGP